MRGSWQQRFRGGLARSMTGSSSTNLTSRDPNCAGIGEKGGDFRPDAPWGTRDGGPLALQVASTGVVRYRLKSPGVDGK